MAGELRVDLREMTEKLPAFLTDVAEKQVRFATAVALTRVASQAKRDLRDEMPRVFDRPTPYTLNSLFMKAATKKTLQAIVWLKDFAPKGNPAAEYLLPQIYGGPRKDKRSELLLRRAGILPPGRFITPAEFTPIDAYGNIRKGFMTKVLSQLRAQTDPYQNETARSRARKKSRSGGLSYFLPDTKRSGQARAIYERVDFAFGSALRPVLAFARKRPTYEPRYRFIEIATKNTETRFRAEFDPALQQALATASQKSASSFRSMPVSV